jgi:hypothetical protein
MKKFNCENGCFYCNKDNDNYIHDVHLELNITNGFVDYEVEYNRLKKPHFRNLQTNGFIGLVCSCGECEDISSEFFVREDGYIQPKIPDQDD